MVIFLMMLVDDDGWKVIVGFSVHEAISKFNQMENMSFLNQYF